MVPLKISIASGELIYSLLCFLLLFISHFFPQYFINNRVSCYGTGISRLPEFINFYLGWQKTKKQNNKQKDKKR